MQLLRDIALFIEVAKTRNFSRAAAGLEMPASTLSRRIALLERTIGLRLLNRTTRRVELTEAGVGYYARCAVLVEEARVAHEQVATAATTASGTLRLSCTPDFARFHLADVIMAYASRHPAVRVELDLTQRTVDLLDGTVDAALRVGGVDDPMLVARSMGTLERALYATPRYLRANGKPGAPTDLARHTCIGLSATRGPRTWHLIQSDVSDADPVPAPAPGRLVAGTMSMARELALRDAGIAILDVLIAQNDIREGSLVRVLPQWRPRPATVNLVTTSRLMPARVRLFGDLLVEHLRGDRPAQGPKPRR